MQYEQELEEDDGGEPMDNDGVIHTDSLPHTSNLVFSLFLLFYIERSAS